MTKFTIHSEATAPEASKQNLASARKSFGFVPNLKAVLAESPAIAEAYSVMSDIFEKTDLSAVERQVVQMTVSRLNSCGYCMAAHSTVSQMQKIPTDVVDALRDGSTIADAKLQALSVFTARMYETRGSVTESDLDAFFGAGYTKANVLDVILGNGLKLLANYTDHIANTPLDAAFQQNAWPIVDSAAA